jgi:hypothetical protein
MTHAAINGWLRNRKKTGEEKKLHNRAINTYNHIMKELSKLTRKNPDDTRYSITYERLRANSEEWITYAWSNELTQEVLSEIPMKKTLTAWEGVLDIIKSILGLEGRTARSHVLAISDQIFEQAANPPAPPAQQAEARVQAEPQAERSTGAEAAVATAVSEEVEVDNDGLWDRLDEIQRLQSRLANGTLNEDQIFFQSRDLHNQYLRKLTTTEPAGALAQLETETLNALDQNTPRTEVPADYLNMEEVLAAAESLAKTGKGAKAKSTVEHATNFLNKDNFHRIRKWITGSVDRPNLTQVIKDAFKSVETPYHISQAFEQAREEARSLLVAVPNLHAVLANPKARRQLYDALELTLASVMNLRKRLIMHLLR